MLGDKKQLLNDEAFLNLPIEYEELKAIYKTAKKRLKELKKSISTLNRSKKLGIVNEEAVNQIMSEFPDLHPLVLDKIEHTEPNKLAHIHLGEIYDYSPEVIRKKITQSKKQRLK